MVDHGQSYAHRTLAVLTRAFALGGVDDVPDDGQRQLIAPTASQILRLGISDRRALRRRASPEEYYVYTNTYTS